MKRRRASAFWTALGVLVLALLGISTSLVLANQAGPTAVENTSIADVSTGQGGQQLYAAPIAASEPLTVYFPQTSQRYFEWFTYQDDFEETNTGWPYGSGDYDYGYKTDGDGSGVYHFRMDTEDDIAFVTGLGTAAGDFDYRADIRLATFEQPNYWYDEYGILISPRALDPLNPMVDGAYTFHIKLKLGSGNVSSWSIAKWAAASKGTRTIIKEQEELIKITDEPKIWNTLLIKRIGNQLSFWVTRQGAGDLVPVWSLTDSSVPYFVYIGFYGAHSLDDNGTYRIEFQYDNVGATSFR